MDQIRVKKHYSKYSFKMFKLSNTVEVLYEGHINEMPAGTVSDKMLNALREENVKFVNIYK